MKQTIENHKKSKHQPKNKINFDSSENHQQGTNASISKKYLEVGLTNVIIS